MRGLLVFAVLVRAAATQAGAAPGVTPLPPPDFGAATPSGEARTLTLEEAIQVAVANNRNLEAVRGLQRQARARIGQARASAGPSVDARADYVRQGPIAEFEFSERPGDPPRTVSLGSPQTRSAEIGATYRISRQTGAAVGAARAGAEAAEATTAVTVNDLVLLVQDAYYRTLRSQELIEVRRQAVAAAQEQLRVAQAEVRAGTKPQFDELRASVQVENQRQDLIQAENTARTALTDLVNVLGIDPRTQLQLVPVPVQVIEPAPAAPAAQQQPPPAPAPRPSPPGAAPESSQRPTYIVPGLRDDRPLPTTDTDAFAEAMERRPEVQEAKENLRQDQQQVRFEQRARWPSLNLLGAYTLTPDATGLASELYGWRLGAGLSLNLWDRGLIRSRVREAQASVDTAQARLEQAQLSVAREVRNAVLNVREAVERRQTTAANVRQGREALRIAQVRYRAGVGTNVEVTDALLALTDAQTNQVTAEYDLLFAQAGLARALGRYAPPTAGAAAPPVPARSE